MSALVERFGVISLRERPAFAVLFRSVVAQQISTRAADTIRLRIESAFGRDPAGIANSSLETLRSFGLSHAKALALQEIAKLDIDGSLTALRNLTDDEIKAQLREVRGVGPWTIDMFLIFCLAREDIWPTADGGLRSAARTLYDAVSPAALQTLGDRFRPFRSIAALYMWKSLGNTSED